MKSAKKTLILSIVSMLVCIAMFVGTTFAWFTNSAKNTGNRIKAGILEVDLLMWDGEAYTSIKDGEGDIFDEAANANGTNASLWEPGKTQIVFLAVRNLGNLAVKYNLVVKVTDNGLADALEYAFIDGVTADNAPAVNNWAELKTAAGDNVADVVAGTFKAAENGVLDEVAKGVSNETDYFAFAVHMKEDADNTFMGKDVSIDLNLVATQVATEEDSFGKDYDKEAMFPVEFATADPANVNEVLAALEPGSTVVLQKSETSYGDLMIPAKLKDVKIVADDGAKLDSVKFPDNADITNLTIDNVNFDFVENKSLIVATTGKLENVTFTECSIKANSGNKYSQKIADIGPQITGSLTFDGCSFENVGRGIHTSTGTSITSLTIKNCKIKNCSSWFAQGNAGSVPGFKEVLIDGCIFENVDGLVKYGPTMDKFTFTNNTIVASEGSDPAVYHYGHDNNSAKAFDITVNELTVSGNKIGTEAWTPDASCGLKLAN